MKDKIIQWVDGGHEPQFAPNPLYPNGVDLDISQGAVPSCLVKLPYPAKRVGRYVVECKTCGWTGVTSTAGRADDPRSVKIACKRTLR